MPSSIRSATLEHRTPRLKLPIAKKPLFIRIAPGVSLGYRRNQTAGTWVARIADGKGGNWTRAIGAADDFDDIAGINFWQAQEAARALGRADQLGVAEAAKPATVRQALEDYEADLRARGADIGNVRRVRVHLPQALLDRTIALLGSRELRRWRDNLIKKKLAPATVNRTVTGLKAAFSLAAEHDERITNRRAWEAGLASIPDAEQSRNVILSATEVRQIIIAARKQSPELGLMVEVAAVTGARISQITRLEVQDLQGDRKDPRLMMPTSHKGRGKRAVQRRPVPISVGLAIKIAKAAAGRPAAAPLLLKPSGRPWAKSDHSRPFARAVADAGLDPSVVTLYALRHSSIVTQLLAGVPVRVVAAGHDTSVAMLERTYSRHIGDHSDGLVRRALIEVDIAADLNMESLRDQAARSADV